MDIEIFNDFLKINPVDGTVLVKIPAGDFLAGGDGGDSNTEQPFLVTLPEYYIALHPVTNAQYKKFMDETWEKYRGKQGQPGVPWRRYPKIDLWEDPELAERPVELSDWNDVMAYCEWSGLRLPSELEWEKAARGIDGRIYPWGNDPDEAMRKHCGIGVAQSDITVWSYEQGCSPYGLYQCCGNVWEWCADYFEKGSYKRYEQKDMTPAAECHYRPVRGGWFSITSLGTIRIAQRIPNRESTNDYCFGFRLAL